MASTARRVLASTVRVERPNLHWRRPVITGIIAGLIAAVCIATDHTSFVVPLAVGAWFTSLTDTRQAMGVHWHTMAWTALWVAAGATIGGLASSLGYWQLVTVAIMSIACGFAGSLGGLGVGNGSLVLVMYAIFAGAPVSDRTAMQTGLLVLAGGAITIVVTLAIYLAFARGQFRERAARPDSVRSRLLAHVHLRDENFQHGIRLALVMMVATVIAHSLGWPHEYWIPMTVAWVARAGHDLTLERTWHRVLGTLAGIVVVVAMMRTAGNSPYELAVLVAAGASMTLIFARANYALAVTGITIAVMSLFAIEGQSIEVNAPYRIWATLIAGGLLALGTLLWPSGDDTSATRRTHPDVEGANS